MAILSSITDAMRGMFFGTRSIVGVSIGSSSIKLCEVQYRHKKAQLKRFAIGPLPPGVVQNREIINSIVVTDVLKDLVQRSGVRGFASATSVNSPSIVLKSIPFETGNKKDIEERLAWEIEQYIPYDPNEVIYDYDISSDNEVLVAATQRGTVESCSLIVEESGLKATSLSPEIVALANIIDRTHSFAEGESVICADIGAETIRMVACSRGRIHLHKEVQLGGSHLTNEIARELSVRLEDAEVFKVTPGMNGVPQEVIDLNSVMNHNFALEVRKFIDMFRASSSKFSLRTAYFCGGASKGYDFYRTMQDQSGITVSPLNPFQWCSYDPKFAQLEDIHEMAATVVMPLALTLPLGGA